MNVQPGDLDAMLSGERDGAVDIPSGEPELRARACRAHVLVVPLAKPWVEAKEDLAPREDLGVFLQRMQVVERHRRADLVTFGVLVRSREVERAEKLVSGHALDMIKAVIELAG